MKNLLATALLATLTATTACVDMGDQPSDTDPGTEQPGKVTINSLLPSNVQAVNLAGAALTGSAAAYLGQTAGGRSLLSYIVDCSLSPTQSITITEGSLQYTFTGSMGLQPNWATKGLNVNDQQLISSCVLSRVNYYGTAVSISDRGASANLNTSQSEISSYVLEEGAFYGNILGATAVTRACQGNDEIKTPTQGDLVNRICTQQNGTSGQTVCNFTFDGPCTTACTTLTGSASTHYDGCSTFSNVITTFVQN